MSFSTLQLTDAGRSIIVSALAGGSIVFTKVGVGNGERPADINAITELANLVKTIGISEISKGDGCANITAVLDNANLAEGYWWREIGIYAKDSNDNEVIYAYAHAGEYADYIPAYSNTSYLRTTMNITVVVGNAENVSAVINEYTGYVTTETYESHLNDYENPHKVTKEQIGLNNVENLSIDDQTPNIEFGVGYETIQNGEKMKTILGKIRLQMNRLISHLSSSNPHKITCSTIGAATSSHSHAATDITNGILPVTRGGTGGNTVSSARVSLGIDNLFRVVPLSADFSVGANYDTTFGPDPSYISGYNPVCICGYNVIATDSKYISVDQLYISGSGNNYYAHVRIANRNSSTVSGKLTVYVLYLRNF